MEIKGGTVDPRRRTQLPNRDIGKLLLFQQSQQRLVHTDRRIYLIFIRGRWCFILFQQQLLCFLLRLNQTQHNFSRSLL